MMNHKLEKLTEQEKLFSEENHNIIYSFLHKFGYSIEEFYNVAVMGYLLAVQIYHMLFSKLYDAFGVALNEAVSA